MEVNNILLISNITINGLKFNKINTFFLSCFVSICYKVQRSAFSVLRSGFCVQGSEPLNLELLNL